MKKIIKTTVILITSITILWIGLSYAEVVAKNTHPDPTYSEYNALEFFLEATQAPTPRATVDRIEDGGIAVVEVVHEDSVEFVDVPVAQLGYGITEGAKLPYEAVANIIETP